jgi:acetyl esterase/lipase
MKLNILIILFTTTLFIFGCQPEPVNPPPTPVAPRDTTIKNIPYGQADLQKFDLGLPANRTETTAMVVVIHGGGWVTGDKAELTWLLNGLKQRGFAVANINYRLNLNTADNYKMQLDDIDSVVHFVLRQAPVYTFNKQKIYIVGHSAGGHLSLCFAYSRNPNGIVKAAGSLAGPTDLFAMSYYNYNLYNPILSPYLGVSLFPSSPEATQRYKDCSPRYQATSGVPPTIFFHGENDPVVFTDQSTSLYAVLGTLNVERKIILYPLTFHDWWADGTKTTNTMDELKNWFNSHP